MRKLNLPFWLAGSCGTPDGLKKALAEGAAGIQVGTAFALCEESGLLPTIRKALVRKALAGEARVFTDPAASPTGFPFKVVQLEGSLSEDGVYQQRRRICDLGFLREAYRKEDGSIGYRCPAEPEASFLAKGGKPEELIGRKCVCNGLSANIGLAQLMPDGQLERSLLTLGDGFDDIARFCTAESPDYTAADVVRHLLG
jgi:nitronate monooxygenase